MPWKMIMSLIGPGPYYARPRGVFLGAIEKAEAAGRADVAHHLRIILDLRDTVQFDSPATSSSSDTLPRQGR